MTVSSKDLLNDLQARGLIAQMTAEDELKKHLDGGSRTLYCGFDPTADSLHLGHLVPLLVLKRFQDAGHNPIALVGGATGLIGDPSFKAAERQLNTSDVVASWAEKIRGQVSQFVKFDDVSNPARVVNNLDWAGEMSVLDFLRDIGKHFSVNAMINKESVQQRLNREGAGISFTEFSYALLQGMDFAELNRAYDCTLQIGGSDQWGNIVGGIDLSRRQNQSQTFGLTVPLVTKSDGTKFGKTESGAVWLDSSKTSQYAFYQFWMNTADADVYKFLKFFTFLDLAEIDAIENADKESGGKPQAQAILAREATKLVHGEEGLQAAERITNALFSGEADQLSEQDLEQIQLDGLPSSSLAGIDLVETPLTSLMADAGLAASGKQVKDALQRDSVFVNGVAKGLSDNMTAADIFTAANGYFGKYFLVKLGKKKHHLFVL
ncbi:MULTISPECIES: tyrosine--tRNA ligase [Marinomonas]|jgi:tyrosyl-tRNA synthetase|uniref:Tyrosine--tRNA ligase n=1 Tax=Marinomonas polaris DSM 16579 TaxID=1122206 RepID=A0A1M5F9Z9_9GAMM|nr:MULTISPECIES: tyrosine--tRNA ligase [Marinomonas]MBU2239050.1 tyrosine--tRNA ligase [Gammaproteobacteria bacterium]PJE55717.1 tyrosyl-tRNA synthetase [Marinomonas sp. BSi20584]SHF88299.1 tyrosyl-tRNA synthetase [Marinomonas polaris DSM 16579]